MNKIGLKINIFLDVFVDYNKVTKEITCAGVKISDVRTCPIELSKNKSFTMKIEEQKFIKFNQLESKVNKKIKIKIILLINNYFYMI